MPLPTTHSAITNTSHRWEKIGKDGDLVMKEEFLNTALCAWSAFEEIDESNDDPLTKRFIAAIDKVKQAEPLPFAKADDRAVLVYQAREEFDGIAKETKNARLYGLAMINSVNCSISLGDARQSADDRQKIPKLTANENIVTGSGQLFTGEKLPNVVIGRHQNMACNTPLSGFTVEPRVVKAVMKTTKPEKLPIFNFDAATTAVQKFPSLTVEIVPQYGSEKESYADRFHALSLNLKATNTSQRLMSVSNMAIKLTHNSRDRTYRTVDGQYRLLPGETTLVNFSADAGGWSAILSDKSQSPSTCIIYDVPVQVDDLGNVTKKENLTWAFTYDPGNPLEQEINTEKSTYETFTF